MPKKLHHYVPRFYLKAWTKNDQLWCLQSGRIRPAGLNTVAAENYFYRLKELKQEDVDLLRSAIIQDSPDGLKPIHEQLLEAFMLPFRPKGQPATTSSPAETKDLIDRQIIEFNENLHDAIEKTFHRHLNQMIDGRLDFLEDPREAASFYRGLMVQYSRTNHIRKSLAFVAQGRREQYVRISNILAHMIAINVGQNLYVSREHHTVLLLQNKTAVPFITTDQPIINIAASPEGVAPPERFELYYPLSPTRAMLLLDKGSAFFPAGPEVGEIAANLHNSRMACHAYRQIYADRAEVLESVKSTVSAYQRTFPL